MQRITIPYYKSSSGAWSLPDEVVESLFKRMVDEGKAHLVFPARDIVHPRQFLTAMQDGINQLFMVADVSSKNLCGFMWLNGFEGRGAKLYFCGFNGFTYQTLVKAARDATDEILNDKDDDGYFIDILFGFIPVTNQAARKFALKAGFKHTDNVPHLGTSPTTGKSEAAAIFYKARTTTRGKKIAGNYSTSN